MGLVRQVEALQHFSHFPVLTKLRSALSGEAGYYLTVYEACLEYILNLDIELVPCTALLSIANTGAETWNESK